MEEKKKGVAWLKIWENSNQVSTKWFFTDNSYHKSPKLFMMNNSIDNIK